MKVLLVTLCTCTLSLLTTITSGQESMMRSKLVSHKLCGDDSHCFENSFCFGNDGTNPGRCKCKQDYYLMHINRTYYECFKASSFNKPCSRSLHCQMTMGPLAICHEGEKICKCEDGSHVAKNGACYSSSKIGEKCQTDFNCLLRDGSNAFCTDGFCECPIKHHPLEDKMSCVASSYLGEECTIDDNCQHTFAKCYGVCNCIAGYVVSKDQTKCLTAVGKFGDPCEEDIQCSEYLLGSYCSQDKICVCKPGEHGYGNKCFPSARVGDRCSTFEECVTSREMNNSITCKDGFCTCLIGVSDNEYGCVIGSASKVWVPSFLAQFVFAQLVLLALGSFGRL